MTASDLTPVTGVTIPPSLAIPHPRPFLCEVIVSSEHASRAVPHVNNVEYLRWVDRIAELHASSAGMSREMLPGVNRMWFVARHELEYLAEAFPGDSLMVATWVRNFEKARSWRDTVVWRRSESRPLFRAATCWVLVDLLSRRPLRIEPAWAAQLEPLESPKGLSGSSGLSANLDAT